MYEAAFNFFLAVGVRDKKVALLISSHDNKKNAYFGKEGFVFTLPALHQLLMAYDHRVSSTYIDCRKMLYRSEINTHLAEHGYHIVLQQSSPTNHVDSNCYCLARLSPQTDT